MMKAKFSCMTSALPLALVLILGLGLFTASQASAQQTPVFEQLSALFENGAPVSDAELIGWRSGRCYRVDQPAVPSNGLLVGWQTQGPDHGPISTGARIMHTLPVYWANGGPGIFDDPSPQIQQGVERYLAREAPMVAGSRYDERTTYGNYVNRFDQEWAIRKVAANPGPGDDKLPGDNKNPEGKSPNDGKGEVKGDGRLTDNRNPAPPPPPPPRTPNGGGNGGQNPPPNGGPNGPGPQPMDFIVARMTRQGNLVQYCYYFKQVR